MRVQLANLLSVLVPLAVTGCTSFTDRPSDPPLDLDDIWVITGYPCDGRTLPLLSRIKQFGKQLTASSLQQNPCFDVGQSVWTGTLPRTHLLASELPVSFDVELTLGATGNLKVAGEGTIASSDRMLLDVGTTPLVVTRSVPTEAKKRETSSVPAADGGGRAGAVADAGMTMVTAGAAGAEQQASGGAHQWYCVNFQESCTCVADLGLSGDMCGKPKPSCCVTFVGAGQLACECWPPESQHCQEHETEAPNGKLVPTCPPP